MIHNQEHYEKNLVHLCLFTFEMAQATLVISISKAHMRDQISSNLLS
jgi:hypothetical protein